MIRDERIKIFIEMKRKVHVNCGSRFYNGVVLELNSEKQFIILMDIKLGELPIMIEDIISIEPYMEERK